MTPNSSLGRRGGRFTPPDEPLCVDPAAFSLTSLLELDVHSRAVDPDQLASAIGKPGGRKQQKEFLEIEALDGTFHGEHGVAIGDRVELTIPAPGPVDRHDADVVAAAEGDAFQAFAVLVIVQIPAMAATFDALAPKVGILTGALRTLFG